MLHNDFGPRNNQGAEILAYHVSVSFSVKGILHRNTTWLAQWWTLMCLHSTQRCFSPFFLLLKLTHRGSQVDGDILSSLASHDLQSWNIHILSPFCKWERRVFTIWLPKASTFHISFPSIIYKYTNKPPEGVGALQEGSATDRLPKPLEHTALCQGMG